MAEKKTEVEPEPFDPAIGDTDEQPPAGDNGGISRRERRRAKKEARRAEKERAKLEKERAKLQRKLEEISGKQALVVHEPDEVEEKKAEPRAEVKPEPPNGKPKQPKAKKPKKEKKAESEPKAKTGPKAAAKGKANAKPKKETPPATAYRRIGHKGADLIVEGNTLASFEAAVEAGAEMVEFDVLRTRDGQLVVAHDYPDAARRRPLTLVEALDAFCEAPLDKVEIDCDLKLPGREAELAGAIAGHGLTDRAMISTMEISSINKLRGIDPDLRLGWTFPKTRRDWTKERWARPAMGAGLYVMRRRFPQMIRERAPELGVEAVWAYHMLITAEAVEAAAEAGVDLFAWTVDEAERVQALAELGVDGIVSNDPRILT